MSKKLDSILNTMPPSTVSSTVSRMPVPEKSVQKRVGEGDKSKKKGQGASPKIVPGFKAVKIEPAAIVSSVDRIEEKMDRIVAIIPYSLKREIKQYLVDHPGDTEKIVLLRSLRAFGFEVPEAYLKDFRGQKSIK